METDSTSPGGTPGLRRTGARCERAYPSQRQFACASHIRARMYTFSPASLSSSVKTPRRLQYYAKKSENQAGLQNLRPHRRALNVPVTRLGYTANSWNANESMREQD